jgi:hypothetical protein
MQSFLNLQWRIVLKQIISSTKEVAPYPNYLTTTPFIRLQVPVRSISLVFSFSLSIQLHRINQTPFPLSGTFIAGILEQSIGTRNRVGKGCRTGRRHTVCSMTGRYDNHMPESVPNPKDCSKIPTQQRRSGK